MEDIKWIYFHNFIGNISFDLYSVICKSLVLLAASAVTNYIAVWPVYSIHFMISKGHKSWHQDCSKVHCLLSSFLKYTFQIPVPLHGGPLSSYSHCLVPMSCETGSWPDYIWRFLCWHTILSSVGGNYDLKFKTAFWLWWPFLWVRGSWTSQMAPFLVP